MVQEPEAPKQPANDRRRRNNNRRPNNVDRRPNNNNAKAAPVKEAETAAPAVEGGK